MRLKHRMFISTSNPRVIITPPLLSYSEVTHGHASKSLSPLQTFPFYAGWTALGLQGLND